MHLGAVGLLARILCEWKRLIALNMTPVALSESIINLLALTRYSPPKSASRHVNLG